MSKKICAISTVDQTLSSFVVEAMSALKKEGYEITLIASMTHQFIERFNHEFRCINLPMSRGVSLTDVIRSTYAFYKIFKKEKFDYIQYATPNASLYASIAAWLVGSPIRVYCQWGIRYVGFHGVKRSMFKCIEKLTCLLSTDIRPASYKNMRFAIAEGHYKAEKSKIIGDGGTIGVDSTQFSINRKCKLKAEVLNQYPLLENKIVFGFIGRLDSDKGVNELLEAFLTLNCQYSNTALLILGKIDKKGAIDESLYNKAIKNKNIIFNGFTQEVAKYISAMDVLVHPSYREGFSMVIQQAMFMGVPIITTDIPGPSEVIEDGKSGMLVPAQSATEIWNAMECLLEQEKLRTQMGEAAYARATKLFGRQRMIALTVLDKKSLIER